MNKLDFNNFIKLLKEEGLSGSEKASIKRSVLKRVNSLNPSFSLPWADRIFLSFETHALSLSLIIVLVFAGTGVSFAAEDALPGDALYAVKVNINEEVRDAFAVHPENKARWSMEKARRRLFEAEILADRNELDEEKESKLLEKFSSHSEDFQEALKALEEEGNVTQALGVIAVAESTLETYRAIIAARNNTGEAVSLSASQLSEAESTDVLDATGSVATATEMQVDGHALLMKQEHDNSFLTEVEDSLFRLNEEKKEANDIIATLSPEDLKKATQAASKASKDNSDKVLRLYHKVEEDLPGETKSFLDAEINIEATYRRAADSLVSEKKHPEAFTLYQKSINISARLKELLRSAVVTDGDVSDVIERFREQKSEEDSVLNILKNSSIDLPDPEITSESNATTTPPGKADPEEENPEKPATSTEEGATGSEGVDPVLPQLDNSGEFQGINNIVN